MIDGIIYKVLSQFFLQISKNHYVNIVLLNGKKDTQRLLLMALDCENMRLIPIPERKLNTVIQGIKQIPYPEEFQGIIDSLKDVKYKHYLNTKVIKLTSNMSSMVSPQSITTNEHIIELEMLNETRLTPSTFVFAAFDGLNYNVYFELENKDIIKIKNWGVLSGINIYINNEYIGEYFLQKNSILNEDTSSFFCQTKMNSILGTKETAGMHMEGFNVYEISDFILSSVGLYNSVAYPENYPKVPKWYTVVVPIIGLQIEDEFGIGSVEFCKKTNNEIKRIVEFDDNFSNYNTFALVHVNNEKIYMAYIGAIKQINQAIDLLVNILKDDSIFSIHAMGEQICERNISIFGSKVISSSLAYIESPFDNSRLSCNLTEIENKSNLIVCEKFLSIKDELEKAELLILKANGTNDKEITPLFNSLKWIRKSWDSNDFDDKIINAIIALEFIVSKEPNVPMMDKATRKRCKNAIKDIIHDNVNLDSDKEEYVRKVLEKFDRSFTETPFMLKLNNLIERLNIPITEDELTLIVKVRKQRNEIIHGKNDMMLPTDEVFRLCECINKIAFYKINSLEV